MGDRLATIDMGRKLGEGAVPLLGGAWSHLTQCGGAEAYHHAKFHLDTSNRLAEIHQRHTDRADREDRQRSDSIGRTVLQTVAQKSVNVLYCQ